MKFIKSFIVVLMIGFFVKGSIAFQLGNQVEISTEAESLTDFLLNKEKLDKSLEDGVYDYTIYSMDGAGNTSNNITGQIKVDTIPPDVLSLEAYPTPFTPNDDGVNDTAKFAYKLSEPAYVTTNIYHDDGANYKTYKSSTDNFVYAMDISSLVYRPSSLGTWAWDGKGGRGELIGGKYTYQIIAEDNVGNLISSETKEIVVDRATSLIPYCYADPDPFSAVCEEGCHTDIKYYISRNNVLVTVEVIGKEEKTIKTLLLGEFQNKGDHFVSWNGDFQEDYTGPVCPKDKTKVCDSAYQFKISAYDANNKEGALNSNTVYVDNTPPYISIYHVDVDYVSSEASLRYNLPENSIVNAALYDEKGALVQNFASNEAQKPGDYCLTWEGEEKKTENVYFKISAKDSAQNTDEKTSEIFSLTSEKGLVLSDFLTTPNPFTPNSDAIDDQIKIFYKLSGGTLDYKVNINILDSAKSTIRELVRDEVLEAGNHSVIWDGFKTGNQNNIADDGGYYVEIKVEDKLGNKVSGQNELILVATRPEVGIATNYETFSPNSDGVKDEIQFDYSIDYNQTYISKEALVKLEVLNSSLEAVWEKIFSHSPGNYSYLWDGKTLLGERVRGGEYYVKISATDGLRTSAISKTVGFFVDDSTPALEIISIEPNPFSPDINYKKDQTVISFSLSKKGYVTVSVKKDGEVIKTLQENKLTEAYVPIITSKVEVKSSSVKIKGIPTLTWDGKNESGEFVPNNNYNILISATDSAGNTFEASGVITVDNTAPVIPTINSIFKSTNNSLQIISGEAEINSSVEVWVNGVLTKKALAADGGKYSSSITLKKGNNLLKVRAEDLAGNVSMFSTTTEVFYDTDEPVISNLSILPNPATLGTLEISFTVSETLASNPVVKINDNLASFSSCHLPLGPWYYDYNVTISDAQGYMIVSIEAVDEGGNNTLYTQEKLLEIDTILPDNPIINNISDYANSKTQLISGKAEAYLQVYIYNNNLLVTSTEASSNGIFSKTITLNIGSNEIKVKAKDSAGNVSEFSNSQIIIYDKTPPEISAVGISPSLSSVGMVTISFTASETLESDPIVKINGNLATKRTSIVGSAVKYEYTYSIKEDDDQGAADLLISVNDLAGNTSTYSADDLLTIDCLSPDSPIFNDLPEYTNTVSQTITGNAEKNSFIYIYNNNLLVTSTETSSSGIFSKTINLDIGNNEVKVKAKDSAGNVSEFSNSQIIIYDKTPPEISDVGISPSLSSIGMVTISFTASETLEADPIVKINGNLATKGTSIVGSVVKYEYTYSVKGDDEQGTANLLISVNDLADNKSTYSADDLLTIDCVPPDVPILNDLSEYTNTISQTIVGKAEKNSFIYIYDNNVLVASTESSSSGIFSKTINLDIGNNEVKVKAKDSAGNVSEFSNSQIIIYDKTPPEISDVGISPSLSSIGMVTISFTASETLEADPIVKINGNLATKGTSIVGSVVKYEYTYSIKGDDEQGTANLLISVNDLSDNKSIYSAADLLTIDCLPPDVPILNDLPEYTNAVSQTIAGNAEKNSFIYIYNNNLLVTSTETSSSGIFSKTITLNIVSNEVKVKAKDSAGNVSEFSNSQIIIYDKTPPEISDVGISPSLSSVGMVTISFKVSEMLEADPIVKINGNLATKGTSIVGSVVKYEYTYSVKGDDEQGTANLLISVNDLAGNKSTYNADDLLTIDCIPPDIPILNDLPEYTNAVSQTITANAEKNSFIYIYDNNVLVASTESSSSGTFSSAISLSIGNNEVKVKAKDAAGNVSEFSNSQIIIYDKTPPEISAVGISPSLSSIGMVTISFTASETLESDPIVKINVI